MNLRYKEKPNNPGHAKARKRLKDLIQITCMVCQELENKGTIFQIFDECYEIANEFQNKYSHDPDWTNQELELDEAIRNFIKNRKK